MKHLFLFFLPFLFALPSGQGQTQQTDFEQLLQEWADSEDLKAADISFSAAYADSGQVIFSYRDGHSLVPASTLKLTTTLTALEVLGADFRFETWLKYSGYIDSLGVLQGDLFIVGGGDPSLGYPDENKVFAEWEAAIRKAGIRKINGRVIADARFFDPQLNPGTWTWEDLGNYYGAGVSGLNINRNEYKIYFSSGKTGTQTTFLRTDPPMPEMTFVNELKAGAAGTGDNAFIYGSPYTRFRYIRGTITPNRSSFRVRGSLPDPAFYAAQGLKRFLEEAGISVSGKASTCRLLEADGEQVPAQGDQSQKNLHKTLSPPLSVLVAETNRKSLNLYAEAFLKMIGRKLNQGDSRREEAAETLRNWWAGKGLDMKGFFMEDGSGLSRYTVLTTRQQLGMLRYAYGSKNFEALYASLPVAGESGSIRGFGRGTRVAGNLRAKSGYLRRVKGYAGYVKTRSGRMVAFSMLVNHFDGGNSRMNRRFEQLMVLLAELP